MGLTEGLTIYLTGGALFALVAWMREVAYDYPHSPSLRDWAAVLGLLLVGWLPLGVWYGWESWRRREGSGGHD